MSKAASASRSRSRSRPRPRRRRWVRWLLLALLVLIVLPVAGVWWMGSAEPDYWRVLDPSDPAVRRGGQHFEQRLSSQVTRVRPADEPWELRVDQQRINQWLAARLPRWLANRGVDERAMRMLQNPMVAIGDGFLDLAAEADLPGIDSVVQLRYEPRVGEDGQVRLVLREVHAGQLPVPIDYVMEQVAQRSGSLDEKTRHAIDTAMRELSSIELTLPLGDGRRVRVIGMKLEDGTAVLTCRTTRIGW